MVTKNASYWAGRRAKTGGKLTRNAYNAYANPSIKNIAQAAWSGVKHLRSLVNVEHKFVTQTLQTSITSSGVIEPITSNTLIPLGVTSAFRQGSSIKAQTYFEHSIFNMSGDDTNVMLRIMLFKYNDDAVPTVTDVLAEAHVNSFYNTDNSEHFRVIYDKTYHLDKQGKSGMKHKISKVFKKYPYHVNWKRDGVTAESGQLYKLTISDTVSATGRDCRTKFTYIDN